MYHHQCILPCNDKMCALHLTHHMWNRKTQRAVQQWLFCSRTTQHMGWAENQICDFLVPGLLTCHCTTDAQPSLCLSVGVLSDWSLVVIQKDGVTAGTQPWSKKSHQSLVFILVSCKQKWIRYDWEQPPAAFIFWWLWHNIWMPFPKWPSS